MRTYAKQCVFLEKKTNNKLNFLFFLERLLDLNLKYITYTICVQQICIPRAVLNLN